MPQWSSLSSLYTIMFSDSRWLTWGLLLPALVNQAQPQNLANNDGSSNNITHTLDVSSCSGYELKSLQETGTGLTARLHLKGQACNAFGTDVPDLTVQVTYETTSRLHVNIFDTVNQQYTIPDSVIERPGAPAKSFKETSDLIFNHQASPFAFWITRRSQPHSAPLFDTRINSLPKTPVPPFVEGDNSTALDAFPLVFEDQYLQVRLVDSHLFEILMNCGDALKLASALPVDTNIYGLGEVVASSGFRRDIGPDGGTIQTMWARDIADPVDENLYGSHPIYLEHRFDKSTNSSQSHGVFLLSAAGGDIILTTPPSSNVSVIEYRMIGGTLDFYFLSGPTPNEVIEQYGALVGLPTWQPIWGFGFHLCRWGYKDLADVKDQVANMRAANIPLEVMWNDIDLYHAVRDFTSDPVSFPADEMRAFIRDLVCFYRPTGSPADQKVPLQKANNQHYIPIVDAAIAKQVNATDHYDPYTKGVEKHVFITNPDGSEYVGQVWPGYTVFPDWFQKNTQEWWTEALRNWSTSGIEFDGIWLDMNEASSFCDGSCGTGANLTNTSVPFLLPGEPGNPVSDYPEWYGEVYSHVLLPVDRKFDGAAQSYNSTMFGPSGNITINGTLTCQPDPWTALSIVSKRGLGAGKQRNVDLNTPPYAIHNGNGRLSIHALATNATHANGVVELDVHNLWGLMEEKATHLAVQDIIPNQRPFLISRSTFPSSGKWTGHWILIAHVDHASVTKARGQLQFMVLSPLQHSRSASVPDIPDPIHGNTDEELCNRWMQLAAFTPFFRNHNIKGAISQEPYRWDSVANASRTAISIRYSLLPYWYTLFANASTSGTPPVRALFFEFPNEPELFGVDSQFLVGKDILVTPVLEPNVSTISGRYIPRSWQCQPTTLSAPLGHINVHIRDGAALLLHAKPTYTIEETRQGPYSLLISQTAQGVAHGSAYIDDGLSSPPGPNRILGFSATKNEVIISSSGSFHVGPKLQDVTVLGVSAKPKSVSVNGRIIQDWNYAPQHSRLIIADLNADLNENLSVKWS
ncbi:hypothetical protein CVT26_004728 [Gymnopilus dilepis]|uniref:Galactose mutarotase N-terminal barrel domain-containing protein n=1 Tax=Gymnopilus dilepis TaxID=231916 RepID=A0A409XZB7_9AGAR|nr:hypothetical protein CVT26_004728 [Gymnopilus dilepis]